MKWQIMFYNAFKMQTLRLKNGETYFLVEGRLTHLSTESSIPIETVFVQC